MNETFTCGHPQSGNNVFHKYGYRRCRTCQRAHNRRHMRRKRAEFTARNGRCSAVA